jgi:ribosomal protein S4
LGTLAGLADSVAEADRKLKEGAVRIDGEVVNQTHIVIPSGAKKTIRVGKRAKVVHMYFPAVGDRVTIDMPQKQGLYEVISASFGPLDIVRLLDNQGNPTITESVPPGILSPA